MAQWGPDSELGHGQLHMVFSKHVAVGEPRQRQRRHELLFLCRPHDDDEFIVRDETSRDA